jgi:hypothetical protein
VVEPGEHPWIEIPARFLNEAPTNPGRPANGQPPIRPWLIISRRIVGRLGDDRLYGWRWQHLVGCRIGLEVGHEFVILDAADGTPLTWTGPAVPPLAVAGTYVWYGPAALLDHPGPVSLRTDPQLS